MPGFKISAAETSGTDPTMEVNGISFVVLKASETLGKLSRKDVAVSQDNPQTSLSTRFTIFCCQVYFIYSGQNHKFASKGFTVCTKNYTLGPSIRLRENENYHRVCGLSHIAVG